MPTEFSSKKNNSNKPLIYLFDNILNLFNKKENKDKFKEIIYLVQNEEVKEPMKLLEKKRKRSFYNEDKYKFIYQLMDKGKQSDNKIIKNHEDNNRSKKGRKTNKMKNRATHDKMGPDNIIKKVKGKIFDYSVKFLNNILDNNKKEDKLFKLDYKYINKIKKEEDLNYLNMPLKELFSKEISPKYITKDVQYSYKKRIDKNSNKNYIQHILNNQPDDTILFIFNMAFRDWLDLFTLKKNVKDIILKYNCLNKDIDCERIQNCLNGVDELLNKIMRKNDKKYLSLFIFLLYNYEGYFYNKKGRSSRKRSKNELKDIN